MFCYQFTPCVLIRKDSYGDRLFTCSVAGIRGVKHIRGLVFSPLIDKAISLPRLIDKEGRHILSGFHHSKIIELNDKILSLIKDGRIKNIFLVGGCDTPGKRGDYYRRFVQIVTQEGIYLEPVSPEFIFKGIFNFLKDKFNIKLISTPESDIKTILNGKR
ncbi:MAG: hypothetical protein NC904_07085 [Candidatus Omnitrophica bacterium]|nr:hypothetical protein [Candidatus Omnitrophota bacterium]